MFLFIGLYFWFSLEKKTQKKPQPFHFPLAAFSPFIPLFKNRHAFFVICNVRLSEARNVM